VEIKMLTSAEIRIHNLLLLEKNYPTAAAFGDAVGISQAQLSALKGYLSVPKMKSFRAMGNALARRIEQSLGLECGWMDVYHGDAVSLTPDAHATPKVAHPPRPEQRDLSALQAATLDSARRLMAEGLLSDVDCLKLLMTWETLIEQLRR
jgi:hypothetical protein